MNSSPTAADPETSIAKSIAIAEVQDRQRDALVVRVAARGEAEDEVEAEVRAEHAEHEDLGVCEVDQPEHAEHQRVADGH